MSAINEISLVILIMLLAFFVLQVVVKQNGQNYITSFFKKG